MRIVQGSARASRWPAAWWFVLTLASGCSSTMDASAAPVQLEDCPFGPDAGDGALQSRATRAMAGPCSGELALCPIETVAPCADGGFEQADWICRCVGDQWMCEISGRRTDECADVDGGA